MKAFNSAGTATGAADAALAATWKKLGGMRDGWLTFQCGIERLQRVRAQLIEIGAEDVRGHRESALAFAAAERAARRHRRACRRILRHALTHVGDHLRLRALALVGCLSIEVEMDVRGGTAAGPQPDGDPPEASPFSPRARPATRRAAAALLP